MKNNLAQYLEETYHNSVSRNCIKIILKSKTEEEYIQNDLSDTEANKDISSGLALEETHQKLEVQKTINSLSTQTEKLTTGMKIVYR